MSYRLLILGSSFFALPIILTSYSYANSSNLKITWLISRYFIDVKNSDAQALEVRIREVPKNFH